MFIFNYITAQYLLVGNGGERVSIRITFKQHVTHPDIFIHFPTSHFSLPRKHGVPMRTTALVRCISGRGCVMGSGILKEERK